MSKQTEESVLDPYQKILQTCYRFIVPAKARVLELGCRSGDLLASLQPAHGLGVDSDPAMVQQASRRYPHLSFHTGMAAECETEQTFDYVILSDLIGEVSDVQVLFESLHRHAYRRTRLVLNFFNNLWRPLLALAAMLGAGPPHQGQNWLSLADVKNLLHLAGWEVIKTDARILWPFRTPFIAALLNRWLAPLLRHFCLTVFVIARPRPVPVITDHYTCTVVVPVRNEAGNIEGVMRRLPDLGAATEVVFVEGDSTDRTWEEIQRVAAQYPHRAIKILKQRSKGKGGAVREGFAAATGQLLFILDGDLTVPPESLPKFYEVARAGVADFVNGVRLVYPMEDEAMRFLNMLGNKFFSLAFSWLLGQPIKDTLCGTKVLFREDYEWIERHRSYFGEFDPFGDFDLLFGAAKLNLRIVDLPIRYRARTYGRTSISRWRHGWRLLCMTLFAARRLKFFG
jgi:hypothetical protein